MSSEFHPSEPSDHGSHVTRYNSPPKDPTQIQATAETHSTGHRLRFNSLTLNELSEELDRRTEETQKLQEEVENATREALRRFGCTRGNKSSGQRCHNYESAEDPNSLSAHQQAVTQPQFCSLDALNQEMQSNGSSSVKDGLQNAIDNCLQQMSDLHLNERHDLPEQESPERAMMSLRSKLQEVQIEKDILSDLRVKDSRKQVDQMEQMLYILQEVQNIKRSADQKLQETEDEALALNRKVETLERTIKEVYRTLFEQQCGHSSISNKNQNSQTLQSLAHVNEDLNCDTEKLYQLNGQSGSEENSGVNKQERVEGLITSLGQEMTLLTHKLSSSKDGGIRLCDKLELLKKLAERQASVHQSQISELESTVSSYEDKVCCLKQQLLEAQGQLFNTRRESVQSLQHTKELQSQLEQLERCCDQQQLKLQGNAEVLRRQLDVAREQLCKTEEEKACLQALLEQKAREEKKSQELLREKDEELHIRQKEIQKHLTRLEEAHSQCQSLQAEQDMLRLRLNDREEMIDTLRLQVESSMQMTAQHCHTIDSLQQENSLVINQLNQSKLEIQQLRAELVQHKSVLSAVELERRQLQASVTEHSQRLREETLEKQQVTTQLELQRIQLFTLTKEHKELQQLHSCKNDELEGVVLKLQSKLRSAHDELEKIRHAMRTLKGVDVHGFQKALGMQKEITTRREQVDSLQSRIKHLEESMEKLQQEKRQQNLEAQRQLQEFAFIREEKRQLANELKTLRSTDQQLRERISELEAILHKMSESFTSCQGFIQLKEQEYVRLKLQHALDLKELKGQTLCTVLTVPPPHVDSPVPSADAAPPSSQHESNTQIKRQSSACELTALIRELRGAISESRRPHTDKSPTGSSFHRRRSAPEREHRTTFADTSEGVKASSRSRRKTCGSEPQFLKTAETDGKTINNSESPGISAAMYTRFPQQLSPGRRSPVHSLLTSDPNV